MLYLLTKAVQEAAPLIRSDYPRFPRFRLAAPPGPHRGPKILIWGQIFTNFGTPGGTRPGPEICNLGTKLHQFWDPMGVRAAYFHIRGCGGAVCLTPVPDVPLR